jgi:hypothetical protein
MGLTAIITILNLAFLISIILSTRLSPGTAGGSYSFAKS